MGINASLLMTTRPAFVVQGGYSEVGLLVPRLGRNTTFDALTRITSRNEAKGESRDSSWYGAWIFLLPISSRRISRKPEAILDRPAVLGLRIVSDELYQNPNTLIYPP